MHPTINTKFIFVTGGVLSGLGKGIVSASIGKLLSFENKVITVKCDGYLNTDPGTMNPVEHGEVFVLDDGGEVDMDFGHYERFLNIDCKFDWNLTSGKIFQKIIQKERTGKFLGKTVQMIPHVTNEIKAQWMCLAKKENANFVLIELGGTIGDIEMDLFAEAARQLKLDVGEKNCMYIHLTYVPKLSVVGEQKTKPTQQSLNILQSKGLRPDVIVGRANQLLTEKSKNKIALFGNLNSNRVISNPDLETVYELPLIFEKEGLAKIIEDKFLVRSKIDDNWKQLVKNIKESTRIVNIAICGKYTELKDSYASISEALIHTGAHLKVKINLTWLETSDIETGKIKVEDVFENIDGIIVPGGFGSRGVEGKIKVIEYVRKNNVPFLGICYGLQLAVTEFARNVCILNNANSTEVNEQSLHPVVDILPEQKEIEAKGGTMRLGSYEANLTMGSKISELYGSLKASERHRHRYEVNPSYHEILEDNGLLLCGKSFDGRLVEFIELPGHNYYVATQGHPELKSRLEKPAPLFIGLVKAALVSKTERF